MQSSRQSLKYNAICKNNEIKIILNKNYIGLRSVIAGQVQTKLFKFRLSTTVREGACYLQEELPKAWGMILWNILCVNGMWSCYNGKIICWEFSSTAKNGLFLQQKQKDVTD